MKACLIAFTFSILAGCLAEFAATFLGVVSQWLPYPVMLVVFAVTFVAVKREPL